MKKGEWQNIFNALALISQLGIIMVASIGIAFFFGFFLDRFLGYKYLFKIISLLIGVASGFYTNYKLIDKFMDNGENDNK